MVILESTEMNTAGIEKNYKADLEIFNDHLTLQSSWCQNTLLISVVAWEY